MRSITNQLKKRLFLTLIITLTGCHINPERDFQSYSIPKPNEIVGTYEYHNDVWGGPYYVFKLFSNKRYEQFTVVNGEKSISVMGNWTFEVLNQQAYLDLFFDKKGIKNKNFGGTGELIRKRDKDKRILITGEDPEGSDEYEKIN